MCFEPRSGLITKDSGKDQDEEDEEEEKEGEGGKEGKEERGRRKRRRRRRKGERNKKHYEVLSTTKYLKPSSHSPDNHTNLSFSSPWPKGCVIYAYSFGWQCFCGLD